MAVQGENAADAYPDLERDFSPVTDRIATDHPVIEAT